MLAAQGSMGPILEGVHKSDSYYFACGGLADLYRGQWTQKSGNSIPVAIKLIRRSTWSNKAALERARKRFLRESQLWSQLRHPYIVPLHGLIFDRDSPGLVMPYYKNGDLVHFLPKNPGVNKLELMCEVASGLVYLHNLKPNAVVHGDIKAANILVTDDHHACLTDFGVAKMLFVSGYTASSVGGTCRWMAPELLDEHDPSPTTASDIWAFGMTILQVFTQKVPFEDLRNDATVIMSLVRHFLPQQPPEINDSVWALLKRCWAFEPSKRPTASTISVVLNIMTSQTLSPDQVDSLMNYLEAEEHRLNNRSQPSVPVRIADNPIPTSTGKPKNRGLVAHIRSFSWDRYIGAGRPSSPEKQLPFPTRWRRSNTDVKHPEPRPLVAVVTGSHAFHCCWPGCEAHFTALAPLRAHEIQHWLAWKRDNDETQSKARGMPGISSLLGDSA